MNTIKIYRLNHLSPTLFARLRAAQMQAAQVWNLCCELHKAARTAQSTWPGQNELQQATKGQFALQSQSVQMVVHAFLANIEATRHLRATHPKMRMKYPWKSKRFYPVHWPAQAVSVEPGRVVLPMGRGRPSIVLHLDFPEHCGACTLVWNRGFELHVCVEAPQAVEAPGPVRATVDLGGIHLAATTTNTGAALIVTGRGIRSLKRQVIDFWIEQRVGSLFIGNPHGVCSRDSGRHHNQRMSLWEYGKDIDYLGHKAKQARNSCFTGSERGNSSRCPRCGHRHKPKGRTWACRACGFVGHRDLVGSVNMHALAFGTQVEFPRSFTYRRPGSSRSRRRADTPRRCLDKLAGQPHLAEMAPLGAGHTLSVVEKPVSL